MLILQSRLALEMNAAAAKHCFRATLHSATLDWNAIPDYVTLEYSYSPLEPEDVEAKQPHQRSHSIFLHQLKQA